MLPVALSQLSPYPRIQKTSTCCLSLRRQKNRPAKVPVRGPSIEVNLLIYFYEKRGCQVSTQKGRAYLVRAPVMRSVLTAHEVTQLSSAYGKI